MKKELLYQNSFSFWISRLSIAMQEQFNRALDEFGITWSQWLLLNHLRQGVNSTPAESASAIGVDRSAITRLVDRLERKHLVMRMREDLDRRSVTLYLTKQGLDLIGAIDEAANDVEASFLSTLHSSEQRMLKSAIQKMLRVGGVDDFDVWRMG